MQARIDQNKLSAIRSLEEGLANACADDITDGLVNLDDGTCDYVELIPVLERIARKDLFCYFDDNGAGGFPRPDLSRETSFRAWASRAIENIKENVRLGSNTETAKALKSHSPDLIKSTLERLQAEGRCFDESLIPILEKIAQKDVYQSYSYFGGYKTEYELGELARNAIQIIRRSFQSAGTCSVCNTLPDDLTVNTGRDEFFPAAFRQLAEVDNDFKSELRRCPGCGAYFNWIDLSSWTGSGNNDEERLIRLSNSQSRLLDRFFSSDAQNRPAPDEVGEYFETIPLHLLVLALRSRVYSKPDIVAPFVPHLVRLLGKNNDSSVGGLLSTYVSNRPERAEEILEAFRSSDEWGPNRLTQTLHHCLRVAAKKNQVV